MELERKLERHGEVEGRGRLTGRSILVVGAGQQDYGLDSPPLGNGRAISLLCAREGAAVAAADIDRGSAAATTRLVETEGARSLCLAGDASEEADIKAMIEQTSEAFGSFDGLVMNVGVPRGYGMAHTSPDDWDEAFAINVRSHFLGCKHAISSMAPGIFNRPGVLRRGAHNGQ